MIASMVFSSIFFLLVFLPLVIYGYYLINPSLRNHLLLIASILFYWWGEGSYLWILIASTAGNYIFGILLYNGWRIWQKPILLCAKKKYKKSVMIAAIFTFQALSYIIDVYRGSVIATRNFLIFSTYLTMFPQLVAGPIVRYSQVVDQLSKRCFTLNNFSQGTRRFIIGLGKKVIVANTVAVIADEVFKIPAGELTTPLALIGLLSYTLQIYYDFSGYSDMAIGLGLIFGFNFPENFNYPYIAQSVREFWRRWHMSLSSWFRDYLYIPLGGNRVSSWRVGLNLLIVFLLCGLWHGAAWTFVIWGAWHGFFLLMERIKIIDRFLGKLYYPLKHIYALIVIMGGWVLFRSETLSYAIVYYRACLFKGASEYLPVPIQKLLSPYTITIIIFGIIGCLNWRVALNCKHLKLFYNNFFARLCGVMYLLTLLLWSIAELFASSYNPFIYFRF